MDKELNTEERQRAAFGALVKIKEICEANDIHYFLMYGTLIGAIRHKGFIPWDDDIDVGMLRPDYEKFIQYCIDHGDFLKPFELLHYRTNKKYVYPIARFSDNRYCVSYNSIKDYGLGMFVDIYPFDNFCQDDAWIKKNRKMIVWIDRCGRKRFLKSKTFLRSAGKYIAFCISRFLNLNRLLQKDDICAQKYNGNGDAVLVKCSCWELEENQVFPKRFFEKTISHEFNGELFPIPICYDELLKICYGDYLKLPPLKDRVGHHDYQAYRKKEQF